MGLRISIDRLDNESIIGWVFDPEKISEKLELFFFLNDEPLGRLVANSFREDLARNNIADGCCAFSFAFPTTIYNSDLCSIRVEVLGKEINIDSAIQQFLKKDEQQKKLNQDLIVFNHIPKTAGSTIRSILARNYPGASYEFFGDIQQYQRFRSRSSFHAEKYDLIHGHVPFGIHNGISQSTHCFAFLRDPITRFFSEYFFGFYPEGGLYQKIKEEKLTFLDYIQRNDSISYLDNLYLKYVAGYHPVEQCKLNNQQLLNEAKTKIKDDFIWCGITEFFDESILLLAKKLKWSPPIYIKKNVSKIKPSPYIPKNIFEKLNERFKFDYELYEFAKERLKKEIIKQPPAFWEALQEMKEVNQELNNHYDYDSNRIYTLKHGVDDKVLERQKTCNKIIAYLRS